MLESVRRRCPWLPAALLLAGALAVVPAAYGASVAYPAKAKVGGVKAVDWVGHWFQWFLATPVDYNTYYDTDGTYAAVIFWHALEHLPEPGDAITQAARLLKISRKSLQMKMKELGLRDPDPTLGQA